MVLVRISCSVGASPSSGWVGAATTCRRRGLFSWNDTASASRALRNHRRQYSKGQSGVMHTDAIHNGHTIWHWVAGTRACHVMHHAAEASLGRHLLGLRGAGQDGGADGGVINPVGHRLVGNDGGERLRSV